ncbi:hypothetical protein [Streptomyces sp. NPDC058861]|uniref:hypothetical protein n=1 Tax=Streptomyces sp. NPDC058861 TaxID=3346653 RepID=UPI0036981FDE
MTNPTAGRPGAENGALPLLALACGAVPGVSVLIVIAKAGLLSERPWSTVLFMAAGTLGLFAGLWVFRRLGFERRRLTIKMTVAAVALGTAAVWGTNAIASQVWKTPWQRYTDELGGPGTCLDGTPYGQGRASVITMTAGDHRPMEVWPGRVEGSAPTAAPTAVLRLHFDESRTRPLTPADKGSRRVLDSYGCR